MVPSRYISVPFRFESCHRNPVTEIPVCLEVAGLVHTACDRAAATTVWLNASEAFSCWIRLPRLKMKRQYIISISYNLYFGSKIIWRFFLCQQLHPHILVGFFFSVSKRRHCTFGGESVHVLCNRCAGERRPWCWGSDSRVSTDVRHAGNGYRGRRGEARCVESAVIFSCFSLRATTLIAFLTETPFSVLFLPLSLQSRPGQRRFCQRKFILQWSM